MATEPVWIAGQWRQVDGQAAFQALDPSTGLPIESHFPISSWADCDLALDAAVDAFWELRQLGPNALSDFLLAYADAIDADAEGLVEIAHRETALAKAPRLKDVELPRTTNQLRLAAKAAQTGSWSQPIIDTKLNIRSCLEPLGPVAVFGPNNFPFAFGSISGGDFAAAIAAGCPVIAKANTGHPGTTLRFARLAESAIRQTGLPSATIQLIYRTSHEDGARLVSDPRIGATGYTGSRHAGLVLKEAADRAGKPIYLELSSVNPVVLLPGAIQQRGDALLDEYVTSGLMGTGQFCTNPGLLLLLDSQASEQWVGKLADRYQAAPVGTLLSRNVQKSLQQGISLLEQAGAKRLTAAAPAVEGGRCCCANTLLRITGTQFLNDPEMFQTEIFGNAALVVVASSISQLQQILLQLEGNLTGCIYSDTQGSDDESYSILAPLLAHRVGRLLNDKMPTGVAVSPAMNHGGPYPSTGHPGFTAVGIPTSIGRFAKLTSYDSVRQSRLPWVLRDRNPTGQTWRCVDGQWTTDHLPGAG